MNNKKRLINQSIPLLVITLSYAQAINPVLAQANSNSQLADSIMNQVINEANVSMSLQNTGNNNTSSTTSSTNDSTDVNTNNQANVAQNVHATANTGYNEASRNISIGGNAGIIKTGDALISTIGLVETNSGITGVSHSPSSVSSNSPITSTGDATSATTSNSHSSNVLTRGSNNAVIAQSTNATATTGENVVDRNISIGGNAGVITTGNAGIVTNYLVAANKGVVIVGGESGGNGPGSGASIITTGDNSRFTTSSARNSQSQLNSTSAADVTQSCGSAYDATCAAITGGNTSDRNINRNGNAGVITTGNAVLSIFMDTDINKTSSAIAQPAASATLHTSALSTGDNTTVDSNSTQNNSVTATQNQDARVNQSVAAVADTGHNTANRNISFGGDAGVITTGNALIYTRLAALTNTENSFISLLNSPQWGSN